MTARVSAYRCAKLLPALLLALAVADLSAQTKITPDKNSYSVADDVKVGQEAAVEAEEEADKELDVELQSDNPDPENVYDPTKGSTHS